MLLLYLIIMDKSLINALLMLGLDSGQIKFFETSFKLGPSTINEIAKVSKLQRSSAYLIADKLTANGFIEENLIEYKKKITTIDPKKVMQMLSSKQRILRRQEIELEEKLPELQASYLASEFRPKVRVFEGNNGLVKVWADILSAKGEILLWTNQETETTFFNLNSHNKFIEQRTKKQIPIRVLAVNNKKAKDIPSQSETLRQTKLLPKETTFSAETYIYDNGHSPSASKVAILDYNKDIIGIIIESVPIALAQKSIFELIWNSL